MTCPLQRQFLQQVNVNEIEFPPCIAHEQIKVIELLKNGQISASYRRLFCRRVLELIENDPSDEEEKFDEQLLFLYSDLLTRRESLSDSSLVIYTFGPPAAESRVCIREQRSVLAASGTTGARTWEAALALGEYLIANPANVVHRRILELGAGTGMLSILAKKLGARMVYATDGDMGVCCAMEENVKFNQLVDVDVRRLEWGGSDDHSINQSVDVVLGADITYDTESLHQLVKQLERLLLTGAAYALICATLRKAETLSLFESLSREAGLSITHLDRAPRVFYYPACAIKLLKIQLCG